MQETILMEVILMAKENKLWEIIENAGYIPIKNRSIVVFYTPENMSERIAKFFAYKEYFVLQLCQNELLLIPFSQLTYGLKKEVALAISIDSIKSIEITEYGLNFHITIETQDDKITLSAHQKELSDMRGSGLLAGFFTLSKNWHKENLDDTLIALSNLKK